MKIDNLWIKRNWAGPFIEYDNSRRDWYPFAPWIQIEFGKLILLQIKLDFQDMDFRIIIFNVCLNIYDKSREKRNRWMKIRKDRGWLNGFSLIISLAIAWRIFQIHIEKKEFLIQILGIELNSS